MRPHEPGTVPEERQAKLFPKKPVVGFQLLGVPRQFELVKPQRLLPGRRPAANLTGIERAGQRPGSHDTSLECARRADDSPRTPEALLPATQLLDSGLVRHAPILSRLVHVV